MRGLNGPRDERSQSEMIGNVLLIGVIAIFASIVGVTAIANITGNVGDSPPQANFEVSATTTNITLGHNGGDSLDTGAVTVRLSNGSTTTEFTVNSANLTGDGDEQFEPGEVLERRHGLGGNVIDVLVFFEQSGTSTVLLDTEVSTRSE